MWVLTARSRWRIPRFVRYSSTGRQMCIRDRLTKEQLILKVWGYESDAEDNNVEVYISFLRKKLEHLHSGVKIRTIRMVGYCLTQV